MTGKKTPFTEEIEKYRKYLQMADADVKGGNLRMAAYQESYSSHILSLQIEEDEWLRKQARVSQR